ncbi:MAG: peptide ABC transporter substrate-binding protein [Oscillospiraceae bacterium]|nr:peptide ABC transporter substrate-binding protein [Oscillospiraceae bacterium]
MKKYLALLLCLLILLLTGCDTQGRIAMEQDLNIAVGSYPLTMDAQMTSDAGSAQYLDPMCGRLFRLDPEKGYVPELAESFELSEDGCTYTFHLREGIRYANGEPIDAGDFVDAFRRIADPLTASSAIYIVQDLFRLKNVDQVNDGTMEPDRLGVYEQNDQTLVIELEQPCPYLPYVLAMEPCSPYNRAFAANCGKDYATSPETLLSSGPFYVDRYEPMAMQVHYTKNPYYIDADKVKLQGITLRQVSNTQQAIMSYQAGESDLVSTGGEYAALSQNDPCFLQASGGFLFYIGGNYVSCEAWQNRNIRMALSFALDRESVVKDYLRAGYKPATRLVPTGFCVEGNGNDFAADPAQYSASCAYDPERAGECWKKGLEELGVSNLKLEFLTTSTNQQLMEILKDQWEKTLPGFTLDVRLVSSAQFFDLKNKGEYELYLLGWGADYPDPNAFFSIFESHSPENDSKYANADFDRLLQEASLETDSEKRFSILHQAEDVFMDDLGAIPFYVKGGAFLISESVKGVSPHFSGLNLQFSFAEKEAES